jgi:hypothetical protein
MDGDSISFTAKAEYLNYFYRVGVIGQGNEAFYFLSKGEQPLSQMANYRERGMVVDHCQSIFGRFCLDDSRIAEEPVIAYQTRRCDISLL